MPTIETTVYPNEAYVLVETDWSGTLLRDTFQRTEAADWDPSADTGQVYTVISGAGTDFPVNGSHGQIVHSAINTTKRIQAPLAVADAEVSGVFYNFVAPTGANEFIFDVFLRFVDINNTVNVRYRFNVTGGTVTATIRDIIGGVATSGSVVTAAGLANSGVYGFRFRAQGATLSARIWDAATAEPSTWTTTFTTTWLTAGDILVGTVVSAGITNPVPITFELDNLVVVDPNAATTECAIVTRTNTVTGEVFQLRPYISFNADGALLLECGMGLWWDTEPPLNVPLEYCVTSCDQPVAVTANPTFEGGVGGWSVTGGTFTHDCTVAQTGSCSGRLTPNGTSMLPTVSQSGFTLLANRLTTVSGWARSSIGWNGVRLVLEVTYDDLTVQTISTPIEILDDLEWRYLSVSFTPTRNTISATLTFLVTGLPTAGNLFNVDGLQVTQLTAVAGSACETVTVSSESVWLKSPLHPCSDIEVGLCSPMREDCEEDSRVTYVGTADDSYAPNTALMLPVNQQYPIPVNRIRRKPSATLRVLAHDCDARDAVLTINEPGDPLLFQAPADYCIPDRYISVGELTETRISVDQREDFRLMTLPYATVNVPLGPADGVCGARIEDLCDIYSSWNALSMAGLSWTDLLLGEASPSGPGQPDPPEGARTWDDVETEFADWDAVEAGGTRDWDELRDGL